MNDSFSVSFVPKALEDLKSIYSYVAFTLKERSTAERLVNRIRSDIRDLSYMPERFALVDWEPLKSMGIRRFSVGNYAVFYMTDSESKTVTVARIVYGGRDIKEIY